MKKRRLRPVLLLALALQAAALSVLAVAGWTDAITVPVLMGIAIGSTSGIMAFGFVGLYAQFMRWSDPRQAGVDFTLFQSMDALVSLAGGIVAGYLAEALGYGVLFLGASLVALASLPVMMRFADR